ncbi:hypothetical protein [Nannocystis punicea]|uniref:Uncharacterized protein n=1 Tax=Nannocystis punicea TaxID=2995304 RepID=A0ABY7HAU8_9BACT|nr:hypothetical protein [Nannocystis poenicansa]WAS96405.1 hypothetical protein O0S08_09620 [Nannocystis poenicansa]
MHALPSLARTPSTMPHGFARGLAHGTFAVMVRAALMSVSLALACAGDFDQLLEQGGQYPITATDTSSGSTSDDATPEVSTTDASTTSAAETSTDTATTTNSGSESDGATGSTGDDGKAVPVGVEVFLTPSSVDKVGEVQVTVSTSRPVSTIDILDGDVPLVLGAAPAVPVYAFEVTSDNVPGDGTHTIRAVAHAADGVSGQAEKDLTIDVAPGGTDVWPPYVQAGPINGFTSAALLDDGSIAAGGFYDTQQGLEAIAVKIDGATGKLESGPVTLGKVALASAGNGPAITVGDDGAVFVASTRPGPTWAVARIGLGAPLAFEWTATGDPKTKALAVTVAGPFVIVVGGIEVSPGTHDLRVWWLAAEDGALLHEAPFAASPDDDQWNKRDEIARGVALVGDEVIVVGEREINGEFNKVYRRAVVLRYSLAGEALGDWTSPGELLEEDGAMAVAALREGGFVFVGWGRDKGTIRQVLTHWFSTAGQPGSVRVESTPGSDAIGYAIGEDREGKLIIAGSRKQPATDMDAWIFAIPGPLGAHVWDVVRNGPGQGPDNAAGLAMGPWGHPSVVGSEFADLQPQAFALRLYP